MAETHLSDYRRRQAEEMQEELAYREACYQIKVAIENGNLPCLQDLLDSDPDGQFDYINSIVDDEDGRTPILVAAACGKTEIVQFLREECGARLDDVDEGRNTPLQLAASGGHVDTVAKLIDLGADVEREGVFALFTAATSGGNEIRFKDSEEYQKIFGMFITHPDLDFAFFDKTDDNTKDILILSIGEWALHVAKTENGYDFNSDRAQEQYKKAARNIEKLSESMRDQMAEAFGFSRSPETVVSASSHEVVASGKQNQL